MALIDGKKVLNSVVAEIEGSGIAYNNFTDEEKCVRRDIHTIMRGHLKKEITIETNLYCSKFIYASSSDEEMDDFSVCERSSTEDSEQSENEPCMEEKKAIVAYWILVGNRRRVWEAMIKRYPLLSKYDCFRGEHKMLVWHNKIGEIRGETILDHFYTIGGYCSDKLDRKVKSGKKINLSRIAKWAQKHSNEIGTPYFKPSRKWLYHWRKYYGLRVCTTINRGHTSMAYTQHEEVSKREKRLKRIKRQKRLNRRLRRQAK